MNVRINKSNKWWNWDASDDRHNSVRKKIFKDLSCHTIEDLVAALVDSAYRWGQDVAFDEDF